MRRREFIAGLGGSAASWPLMVRAQQPALPVVGFLNGGSPAGYAPMVAAFKEGLQQAGFVEGRNVTIEYRWAEGRFDRLPELAGDLVRRKVNVIAATSIPGGPAAKAATTTIPIVFTTSDDPVRIGLVASLNRPGGNLTGVTSLNAEVGAKRLELLHQMVPTADTIGYVANTSSANAAAILSERNDAARLLGVRLHVLHAASEAEYAMAFATLARLRIGAAMLVGDPFQVSRGQLLAGLALEHGIPTAASYRGFVRAGGLMSYGGSFTEQYRIAGTYVGRILKGEKPVDLPVQQATRVELVLNLKTANAIGIEVPPMLLARADEVIE